MTYYQCPDCEWDCILPFPSGHLMSIFGCPICMEDSGRFVFLKARPATDDDQPEYDVRKAFRKFDG